MSSTATSTFWKVKNSATEGSLLADSAGNLGVYSDTLGGWLLRSGKTKHFAQSGSHCFPIPGTAFSTWSKTLTLPYCPLTTVGLICCDFHCYLFSRTGTGTGTTNLSDLTNSPSLSGSISSLTISGDSLVATSSASNSSWFAIWLSSTAV